jgi:hypothetical protein
MTAPDNTAGAERRQCGAVHIGRLPMDGHLFRCGKEAGHHLDPDPEVARHGEWQDMGVATQDPDGSGWAGRVLDSLWEDVTQGDPDAWRAPDDADRSADPPPDTVPESSIGWGVTGRGKRPGEVTHIDIKVPTPGTGGGTGSVSISEVRAAMAAANALIEEAQQALYSAQQLAQDAANMANSVLEGSGHEAAHAGLAHLTDAEVKITETIQVYEAAKGEFGTYVPGL